MKTKRAIGTLALVLLVGFCQNLSAQSGQSGQSVQCLTYKNLYCPAPGAIMDCSVNACRQVITYEGGSGGAPQQVIFYICDAVQEVTLKSGTWNAASPRQPGEYPDGIYVNPIGNPVYCAEVRACSHGQLCPPGNLFCQTTSSSGYGTAHYAVQISGVCP
jgi:hypothetical protein